MFDSRAQSIPECFEAKMVVDRQVAELRRRPVVPFASAIELLRRQQHVRFLCKKHLERARINPGGGVSA